MNYLIQSNGETHGPYSLEQVGALYTAGRLKQSAQIRSEDNNHWSPLYRSDVFPKLIAQKRDEKNPMAVVSLWLGIASMILFGVSMVSNDHLWLATSVPAIFLGHMSLRRIRLSSHPMRGFHSAKAGLWMGYLTTLIFLATALLNPPTSRIAQRGNQTRAISHCRQIITALRLYASDHNGKYPDAAPSKPRTANEAFRLLFTGGQVEDEQIFGSPLSVFQPDGNIGHPPDYLEAVKPGENHWAITKGLDDNAPGSYPLVYENPTEATWPPKWSPSLMGTGKPGRTWPGGKVIIGMNDGSVSLQKLASDKGERVGLPSTSSGLDLFTINKRRLEVLNVEQKH